MSQHFIHMNRGAHPLWGNDAFPLCFRFPLFPKILQTQWKMFPISPFPKEIFQFSSKKFHFWWPFVLVVDSNFWISPYFRCFSTFPPYFGKIFISPHFFKFPLWFRQIYVYFFYLLYVFFVSPSLTMMHLWHHTMHVHVLDASAYEPGHILSRIYNCTKPGNRPIDNATTAHVTVHISFLKLHKLWSTAR